MTKNSPFLALLLIGSLGAAVLTFLCLHTLDSGEDAKAITRNFDDLQGWLTRVVPLVSLCLLFLQTRAYKLRRASGGLFVVCWLYFSVFTAVDYIWLSDVVFHHTQATGTWEGGFNATGVIGAALMPAFGLMCALGFLLARAKRGSASQ